MNPAAVAGLLSQLDNMAPEIRTRLKEHFAKISPNEMLEVAKAWYGADPDAFEAFIKPLAAADRAALRDYLHRDFMSRSRQP